MKTDDSYLKKRSPPINPNDREENIMNEPCNNKKNGYVHNKMPQNDHINEYHNKRNQSTPRHYDKHHNNYHNNRNVQFNPNMPTDSDRFYGDTENMFPFNMSMVPMNVPIGINGIPMGMANMAIPNMMNMGYYNQIPPWAFAGIPNYCNFYPGKFRYDKRNDGYRDNHNNDYNNRNKYQNHNQSRDPANYNREIEEPENNQDNKIQIPITKPDPPGNYQAFKNSENNNNEDTSRRQFDRNGKNQQNRQGGSFSNGWRGPKYNHYTPHNLERAKPNNKRNWSMRDSPEMNKNLNVQPKMNNIDKRQNFINNNNNQPPNFNRQPQEEPNEDMKDGDIKNNISMEPKMNNNNRGYNENYSRYRDNPNRRNNGYPNFQYQDYNRGNNLMQNMNMAMNNGNGQNYQPPFFNNYNNHFDGNFNQNKGFRPYNNGKNFCNSVPPYREVSNDFNQNFMNNQENS